MRRFRRSPRPAASVGPRRRGRGELPGRRGGPGRPVWGRGGEGEGWEAGLAAVSLGRCVRHPVIRGQPYVRGSAAAGGRRSRGRTVGRELWRPSGPAPC